MSTHKPKHMGMHKLTCGGAEGNGASWRVEESWMPLVAIDLVVDNREFEL